MGRRALRLFTAMALLGLISLLAGCGGGGEKKDDGKQASPAKTVTLRMSSPTIATHPYSLTCQKLADLVSQRTNGAVKIEVVPGGQLGSTREVMEGVILGTVDMAIMSTADQSNHIPQIKVFDLPFLFPSMEVIAKVVNGPIGQDLAAKWESKGVKLMALGGAGYRVVAAKRPIKVPEDMNGLKIRTIESATMVNAFKAMGASPTPMDWGQTYSAVQTGVLDGVETAVSAMVDAGIHEVAPHFSKTNHSASVFGLVMNMKKFQSLSPEQQKVILDAAKEAAPIAAKEIMAGEAKYYEKVAKTGTVTEPDIKAFQEKVKSVYDLVKKDVGEEFLNRVLEAVK